MEQKNTKINIIENVITSLKRPDTINISNEFRDIYFSPSKNPELLKIPIIAYRIVFQIIADMRNFTYSTTKNDERNKKQLSLFDESMRTVSNSYTKFKYKISELDEHRNIKKVKESLEFLEQYQKAWYNHKNSKGKTISSYGGLISQPSYSDAHVTFLVSSYWIEKLIELNNFNPTLYDTLMKMKESRHLLFYMWILRLGDNGTKVKYQTINNTYDLHYKSARDLYINFLVPFKKKLNQISGLSYGVGVQGEYINIVKVPIVQVENLEEKTISTLMIRQKVKYFKERHQLNVQSLSALNSYLSNPNNFNPLNQAYKLFVKECRVKKIKASNVVGEEFKKEFQIILLNIHNYEIWNNNH